MLRKSILVLATAIAVGSAVVSTSAFAFGPIALGGPGLTSAARVSVAPPILVAVISLGGYSERFAGHYGGYPRPALGQIRTGPRLRGLLGLLCDHPELPHEHGLAHATGLRLRLRQQPCPLAHKMPIGGEPAPQDAVLGHAGG